MRGLALLVTSMTFFIAAPAAFGQASADTSGGTGAPDTTPSGGAAFGVDPAAPPRSYVAGTVAKRVPGGYAAAPTAAPVAVQEAIFAANEIVGRPYVYGGGHASFDSDGYDCSGTVSYLLHGGNWLASPLPSGNLMRWGASGSGRWVTVYANGGHTWVKIAGLRLDTSSAGERVSSGDGPRWRKNLRGGSGFVRRHPLGF